MSDVRVTYPRKRARSDSVEEQDLPATATVCSLLYMLQARRLILLQKDEEFWLEDGTVILITGYVQFRVYSGILANHSTVFKEIFSEPHSVRHVSVHGGHDFPCPVVRLSDSPHDLRHLLRVYMPHEDTSYASSVHGLLRVVDTLPR